MTSYDDWKTTAPDEEWNERCGCVMVINTGIRFVAHRCVEHEALFQAAEARREARALTEKESAPDDTDDDLPF